MVDLNFKVKGQKLKLTNKNCGLVNKSNNYINLYFTFEGEDWTSKTKYAILNDNEDHSYQFSIIDNVTPITVPSEVVKGNYFIIGVYGVETVEDELIRITTNIYQIRLKGSNYTTDLDSITVESKDVITDIYNQLGIIDVILQNKVNKDELEQSIDTDVCLLCDALSNVIRGEE